MEVNGEARAEQRPRIALGSIGCKLNQAEAEFFAREFADAGYRVVSPADEADVYVLNTCTVTHIADRKSRHWLRSAHRQNPDALLVATGCYAERAPRELARLEGISLVLGNAQKPQLLGLVSRYMSRPVGGWGDTVGPHHGSFRTRALVKVQDGCNNFCTYCIVPLVRGRERSLPLASLVAEVERRVAEGYKEVVLTGVKLGSYSCDGIGLQGLLERILAETGVTRLRLSSLQPQEISAELIKLWQDPRLCRHFHLSLQSGSDGVLRRMGRGYATADYQRTVSLIRALVPGAAITTDVIVGFPGETGAEFGESYEFCQEVQFARIHVFSYSPRQGTQAARMPQPVPDRIKKEHSLKMLALAAESARNFRQQFRGKVIPVLWEQSVGGIWSGLTDNYIKVYTKSSEDLTNGLQPVRLTELWEDGVWGETDC